MLTFTAVVERDRETSLFFGYILGWPGAQSQGETLDELNTNLRETVEMLLEDGEPALDVEFCRHANARNYGRGASRTGSPRT